MVAKGGKSISGSSGGKCCSVGIASGCGYCPLVSGPVVGCSGVAVTEEVANLRIKVMVGILAGVANVGVRLLPVTFAAVAIPILKSTFGYFLTLFRPGSEK